eukprot:91917-Chlamydomonas_euryale.AAC.3
MAQQVAAADGVTACAARQGRWPIADLACCPPTTTTELPSTPALRLHSSRRRRRSGVGGRAGLECQSTV